MDLCITEREILLVSDCNSVSFSLEKLTNVEEKVEVFWVCFFKEFLGFGGFGFGFFGWFIFLTSVLGAFEVFCFCGIQDTGITFFKASPPNMLPNLKKKRQK